MSTDPGRPAEVRADQQNLDNPHLTLQERADLGCTEAKDLLAPTGSPGRREQWRPWLDVLPDPSNQVLGPNRLAAAARQILADLAPDGFVRKALATLPQGADIIGHQRADGLTEIEPTLAIIDEQAVACLSGPVPSRPTRLLLGEVVNYLRAVASACESEGNVTEQADLVGAAPAGVANGPGCRGRFYWEGDWFDFSQSPLRYQLCRILWDAVNQRPHQEVSEGGVITALYGEGSVSETNLKGVVKEVNKAFESKSWSLRVKRGGEAKVWLDDGSP